MFATILFVECFKKDFHGALVFYSSCNNLPQTYWFKKTQIYCLTVLEVRNLMQSPGLRSRCEQDWVPSGGQKGLFFLLSAFRVCQHSLTLYPLPSLKPAISSGLIFMHHHTHTYHLFSLTRTLVITWAYLDNSG